MQSPRVTYNRVLLLDLNPLPNCEYVSCVTFANSGIPEIELKESKFTAEFRLQARELPIYNHPRIYYVVAKVESNVDFVEELRATTAVNQFVRELRKAGKRLDLIAEEVVANFKSRVQKRIPYVRLEERDENPPPKQTRRKRPAVSSSDPDDRLPALKTLGIRYNTTVGQQQSQSQAALPPVVTKKPRKNAAKKKTAALPTTQPPAAATPTPPPPTTPTPTTPWPTQLAAGRTLQTANTTPLSLPQFEFVREPDPASLDPVGQARDGQAIVLATAENPIIMDPADNSLEISPPVANYNETNEAHIFKRPHRPGARTARQKTDIAMLIDHIDAFQKKVDRRHIRFSESLKYIAKKTETVETEVREIKQRLQSFGGQLIAAGIAAEAKFPFNKPEDLMAYIQEEPDLSRAIARYVHDTCMINLIPLETFPT